MSLMIPLEQELSLVNEIKQYGALYDKRHKDFRHYKKREKIWGRISEKIGLSISDCKNKWTSLRKQYVKKNRLGIENWVCGENSECNFMEILSFITHTDDPQPINDEVAPKKKKKKKEKKEHQMDDATDGPEKKKHKKEHDITDDSDRSEKKKHKKEQYDKNNTDGLDKKKQKKEHADSTDETDHKKRKKEHYDEDNSENETQDIASTHKLNHKEANEQEIKWSETSGRGNMSVFYDSSASSYKSATHKFFETMADFVEKLPADLQAQIRLKVCHIVTETEIKYHGQEERESRDSFSYN